VKEKIPSRLNFPPSFWCANSSGKDNKKKIVSPAEDRHFRRIAQKRGKKKASKHKESFQWKLFTHDFYPNE
jgi:hypothetical protein